MNSFQTAPRTISSPSLLGFVFLRDDECLGIFRMQYDREHSRLVLVAGVVRDAMQAASWFVEGIFSLQSFDRRIVDSPVVFTLDF
jgi:hypothetical protein